MKALKWLSMLRFALKGLSKAGHGADCAMDFIVL
jgi:hypothetical protein